MRLTWLDRILTADESARPAAVVRIVIGIAAILKAFQTAPLVARLGDPEVLRIPYAGWLPSLADVPPIVVIGAWITTAVAFTIGFRTTYAGLALAGILAAVLLSDQQLYSNHLYLLGLLVLLLTLARAGSAISIDAMAGRGDGVAAAWPLWLIRVQISIVYLFAGLSKMNATFLSGTVVAVTLRRDGPLAIPLEWRTFEPMAALSILAILTELFLAVALWLPRWRPAAFVVGLGLHVGIAVWFLPTGQLLIFTLIILAPYLLFLDAAPRGATVVWDNSCGFCGRWVRLFGRLDWLHAIRFVPSSDTAELHRLEVPPADADRAMQLVHSDRRAQGFRAVVGVLALTPIGFLWAPILRIPSIAFVGDVAYRRVAERRSCTLAAAPGARPAAEQ